MSRDDCRHIAIETITGCKYIVSWNFKHFVNIKTIRSLQIEQKPSSHWFLLYFYTLWYLTLTS